MKEYEKNQIRTPVHFCVGQEAVPVGLSINLNSKDKVLSNHRSHGHFLSKGGNLTSLFAECLGKQIGCAKGRGGSQHLIDLEANFIASAPILGGTLPVAAGIAFSNKLKIAEGIVIAYLGDAVLEEGIFYETLSFSSLHNLPILFVVENNRLSVHTYLNRRQPVRNFKDIGNAFSVKSLELNGNDVAEVSKAGKSMVDFIRNFNKPGILFFETYRQLEHVGPNSDFQLGYRDIKESKFWLDRDPLKIAFEKLKQKNVEKFNLQSLEKAIDDYIILSWSKAENSAMAKHE